MSGCMKCGAEPRISIIVPCYNVRPWVADCIDSILSNEYCNKEIIVIDDGSDDGTSEVVAAYADLSEVTVLHQSNRGVSAARNRGIEVATGDWLMFVDGDDLIDSDCLAVLAKYLITACPATDAVSFGFRLMVEKQNAEPVVTEWRNDVPGCNGDEIMKKLLFPLLGYSKEDIENWGSRGLPNRDLVSGRASGKLVRSKLVKENAIRFREDLKVKEDTLFFSEALLFCRAVESLDRSLWTYRIRVDRSNTVAVAGKDKRLYFANKVALLRARYAVRDRALLEYGCDITDSFVGSIFLSVVEVALTCALSADLGMDDYMSYRREAEECIRRIDFARLDKTEAKICFILTNALKGRPLYVALWIMVKTPLKQPLIAKYEV